jgi:hypothetical protein
LHLRCSLCSQESAAAQGLWALFRNLNRRVAYYRSLHSFRLTTAGRFALRASAHWAHTSLRLHTRQETEFPAPSPFRLMAPPGQQTGQSRPGLPQNRRCSGSGPVCALENKSLRLRSAVEQLQEALEWRGISHALRSGHAGTDAFRHWIGFPSRSKTDNRPSSIVRM